MNFTAGVISHTSNEILFYKCLKMKMEKQITSGIFVLFPNQYIRISVTSHP